MWTVCHSNTMVTLNYSRRSIIFFKPILQVSSLFGLVPPYDFSKKKLVFTKCYIGYTLVLKGVILYSMTVGFGNKYQHLPSGQSQLFFVFSVLVMVLGGATIMQVMTCSYQSRLKWQDLFQRLSSLESVTFLNTEDEKEPNVARNALLHFIFGNIFLALAITAYYYFFDELDDSDGFRITMFFYNFTISIIINNLCIAVKLKFAGAHEKLKTCKHAQFYNAIQTIRKCRIIYQEMYLIVDIINGIFGPTIFLMHFLYGIQVLEVSTTLFVNSKTELDFQSPSNFAIVLVLSLLFLVNEIHLMFWFTHSTLVFSVYRFWQQCVAIWPKQRPKSCCKPAVNCKGLWTFSQKDIKNWTTFNTRSSITESSFWRSAASKWTAKP